MNFKDTKPQNIPHFTQILAKLDVSSNFYYCIIWQLKVQALIIAKF